MLHLRTFGTLRVTAESRPSLDATVQQRRMLALLAVIAASGRDGVSRERVIGLLWPDGHSARGRGSLSQAMYSARKSLQCEDLFIANGDALWLNPMEIEADIVTFYAAMAQDDMAAAANLYRGPFLDDFHLQGGLEFDQWVECQRRRAAEGAAVAFDRLAVDLERAGDWARAADWRRRQTETSPYDALAAQRLAAALRNAGDRTTALHRLQMHATLVRSDLEVEPDPAVLSLISELREPAPAREPMAAVAPLPFPTVEALVPLAAPRLARSTAWPWRVAFVSIAAIIGVLLVSYLGRNDRQAAGLEIAPFSVTGADASLAFLRDGLPQLMRARLAGADRSWGDAGRGVLSGSVVGDSRHFIVTASWPRASLQSADVTVSAEGALENLSAVADALAARLLVARAGETDRLPNGVPRSLPALRSYLDGLAYDRRGSYLMAIRSYELALSHDTTFGLAALHLAIAADRLNAMNQHERAVAIAWTHRAQLSERDQTRLIAFTGPAFPAPSTRADQQAALNAALKMSANRPELLLELAQRVARTGRLLGIGDTEARAEALFARVLRIDSSSGYARGMLTLLERRRNRTALSRTGDGREFPPQIQWRLSAGDGSRGAAGISRDRLSRLDDESLIGITRLSLFDGVSLEDGEQAARVREQRANRSLERLDAILALHAIALNQGRPQRAFQLTRQLAEGLPGSSAHLRLRVLDGLYGRGDSVAGNAAARRLAEQLAANSSVTAEDGRFANLCVVAQWELAHENGSSIGRVIEQLRSAAPPRASVSVSTAPAACAEMLSVWWSVIAKAPDASARIARLDSLVLAGPSAGDASAYAPILIARLFERIGRNDQALAAIRRRPYLYGWPRYLTTALRKEARLAALAGDRRASAEAYRQYLALRQSPEPGVASEVARIRREAEVLMGAQETRSLAPPAL